jgi:hypothetical protein
MEIEEMMAGLLVAIRAGHEEMVTEMRAGHEEMMAEMRAWRKEMKADLEVTEAYPGKMGGKSRGNEVCSGT